MFTLKAILAAAVTAIAVALWIYAPLVAVAWSYPLQLSVSALLPCGDDSDEDGDE